MTPLFPGPNCDVFSHTMHDGDTLVPANWDLIVRVTVIGNTTLVIYRKGKPPTERGRLWSRIRRIFT